MIQCTVYKCRFRSGRPCCTYCDEKNCLERCENHPDRCKVWRDPVAQKAPMDTADEAEAVRLALEGVPRPEIARRLDCSKQSVDRILQKHLGKQPPGAKRRLNHEEIFRLRGEGLSIQEIAKKFNCADGTVAQILRKGGGSGNG